MRRLILSFIVAGFGCDDSTEPVMNSAVIADAHGRVPDLVCPGVPGCESADGILHAGVGVRSITPPFEAWTDIDGDSYYDEGEPFDDVNGNGEWDGVWMAGFGMGRSAVGIHDDNWVRALSLRRGDLRVGLVVMDLVGYFHDRVVDIRRAAASAGLDYDHILVATTHQHEGQDTMGLWGPNPATTGVRDDYMAILVERAVSALSIARDDERAASLTLGVGDAPELVADSRQPWIMDSSVYAAKLTDTLGAVFATVVIFGNHPEALSDDNRWVTSDYPHYLREAVEAHYPGSTNLFFAGNLGGLTNPLGVTGCPDAGGAATCHNGEFEKARYIGEGVAGVAISALEDTPLVIDDNPILELRRNVYFPPGSNLFLVFAFQVGLISRQTFWEDETPIPIEEAIRGSVQDAIDGRVRVQTEVNSVRLGPLELLAVPGELYSELYLEQGDGRSFVEVPEGGDYPNAPVDPPLSSYMHDVPVRAVINQANDAVGYIIPKTQFDVDPPHAYEINGQYGEVNSLGADSAPFLHDAVREMYDMTPR